MEGEPQAPDVGVAPSEDELRGACEQMLVSWDSTYLQATDVSLRHDGHEPDAGRFLLVLAFAAHTHHLTGSAGSLLAQDDYASAVPLLRVAYESALTAAWATESEDAALALHGRYVDLIGKLRGDVAKTG